MSANIKILRKPVLLLLAIIICLVMLRLGVWQLDRAQFKQDILNLSISQAAKAPTSLAAILATLQSSQAANLRFRQVELRGRYLTGQSVLIDNQVVDSKVGYWLVTPFEDAATGQLVMVNRGWLPVGQSRAELPQFDTPGGVVDLLGRLNLPPAKPPLWKDEYAVSKGSVWQYLAMDKVAQQLNREPLPLVLELAPEQATASGLVRKWPAINDKSVAKHKGYAFQWFAMAIAFLIACIVLEFRSLKRSSYD